MLYHFWDYWEFRHKVTFDGVNRLILVNNGETSIDVQEDIYSAWKEWLLYDDNIKFAQAMTTVGGEPTVEGQRLDVTYFLINDWKLKPYSGAYTLNIIGNLFDIEAGDIFVPADDTGVRNNINITTNTSVIVRQVAGGSGETDLTDVENSLISIENRVISVQSTLNDPVEAQLTAAQSAVLAELQVKMNEIWQIHGIDPNNNLTVDETSRNVSTIAQVFEKQNDGSILVRRTS